jgi:hypothetical protein
MPDTVDAPARTDSNGYPEDNRFRYYTGNPGTTQDALGVAAGGKVASDPTLAAVAGVTPTGSAGQISTAFTAQAKADSYQVEYWLTNQPAAKKQVTGTGTPIVAGGLAAGSYSVRVRAQIDYARGEFVQGPWSATSTGVTVS